MPDLPWILVEDYGRGAGWARHEQCDARARAYCEMLERGQILFFREPPFDLPAEDRKFLITQEWAELRMHKNVSYRPATDVLKGVSGSAATVEHLHSILRNYSGQVDRLPGEISFAIRRQMDSRFFQLSPA